MNDTVNFEKLLAKKSDDVKPPVALPEGSYEGRIAKQEFKSSAKGLGYLNLSIKLVAAKDDVDADALRDIDLSQKTIFKSYFFNQDGLDWTARSEVELLDLIKSIGVSTQGRGLGELIAELLNASVLVEITNKINPKNPEEILAEVGKVQGA